MSLPLSPLALERLSTAPFCAPQLFGIDLSMIMTQHQSHFNRVSFKKNQSILQIGDYVEHLYFIKTGFAWDTQTGKNGLEKNMLMFPQTLIGLNSVAHHQKIIYSIKALTPIVAYKIPYAYFKVMLSQEPTLTEAVLKLSNLTIRSMGTVNMQNLCCTAEQKVCQLLYCHYLCEQHYPALQKIYFSQQKVAGLAGVHRVSVNHIIKDLKQQGILKNINGEHKIIDLDRLIDLAFNAI